MKQEQKTSSFSQIFALLVIPVALLTGFLVYYLVLGDTANFEGGDPEKGHPVPEGLAHWFGVIYKGGIIVPVLMSLLLIVITFSIERGITIMKARGTGSVSDFVRKIKSLLSSGDIENAMKECDRQKGSVANVIRAGLGSYSAMAKNTDMAKDQKIMAIQKEVEEATTLELPMLEKNLVFLSTITSIATLVGLLGTVIGMIKAFAALANAGAPDATQLSNGISEALINTALGIGTSALAIIMYNVFTTSIDKLTYGIDEAGYSITQSFATKHN